MARLITSIPKQKPPATPLEVLSFIIDDKTNRVTQARSPGYVKLNLISNRKDETHNLYVTSGVHENMYWTDFSTFERRAVIENVPTLDYGMPDC